MLKNIYRILLSHYEKYYLYQLHLYDSSHLGISNYRFEKIKRTTNCYEEYKIYNDYRVELDRLGCKFLKKFSIFLND